jgi:hypothetical protein
MWDLFARGGSEFRKNMTEPECDSADRKALIKLNLLAESKEKEIKNGKECGKELIKLNLTDFAWDFLGNNLRIPENQNLKHSRRVLERIVLVIANFLKNKNFTLADFFADHVSPPKESHKSEVKLTAERLLNDLKSLDRKHFMTGGGIRLAVLREVLKGYPKKTLDALLLELQAKERLVLYRFDTPSFITPEDKKAALFVAEEPRHYIFLK